MRLKCAIPCFVNGKPWETDDVDDDTIAFRQYEDHMKWVHGGGNIKAEESKNEIFEQLR